MATPFDFAAPDDDESDTPFGHEAVTDRQRGYLHRLLMRKGALAAALADPPVEFDPDVFDTVAHRIIDGLDKWGASARIDRTVHEVAALEEQVNERKMANAPVKVHGELDDGFYELLDSSVCKVQHAVNGSGNQYAKLLNTETGTFDYTPGLITRVRKEAVPLTMERAQELGRLYGICMRCGRTLTDENSIEAGIGPRCREMAW